MKMKVRKKRKEVNKSDFRIKMPRVLYPELILRNKERRPRSTGNCIQLRNPAKDTDASSKQEPTRPACPVTRDHAAERGRSDRPHCRQLHLSP